MADGQTDTTGNRTAEGPFSKMTVLGAGANMLQQMMKDKNVVSAGELLTLVRENSVRMIARSMTVFI